MVAHQVQPLKAPWWPRSTGRTEQKSTPYYTFLRNMQAIVLTCKAIGLLQKYQIHQFTIQDRADQINPSHSICWENQKHHENSGDSDWIPQCYPGTWVIIIHFSPGPGQQAAWQQSFCISQYSYISNLWADSERTHKLVSINQLHVLEVLFCPVQNR